jgi:uncharacterized protein (DUF58 family)
MSPSNDPDRASGGGAGAAATPGSQGASGSQATRGSRPGPGSLADPEKILRRLEWTVIRRLDGLLQGDYRTLFRGFGLDLAELREYQLHDDVRYIDWNVTARLQTPYVRQYNEDRELNAWFLLDLSPSVDFGSVDVEKRSLLTEFVAVIARVLTRHGNRVGAVFYGDGVDRIVPAGGGRRHVLHLLNTLIRAPRLTRASPTRLQDLLETTFQHIKRRSLLFIVSDFFSEAGWGAPLGHLAQRHEMLAVRVFDPLELALPDVGMVVMSDAETGEQVVVDTHDRKFRARFAERAKRHEETLRTTLAHAGVDALELSTRDDLVDAVIRYAVLRKQQTMLACGVSIP